MIAEKNDNFEMTEDEVRAIMKELEHQFISYENPIAHHLVTRMMQFLREIDNAGKS